MILEESISAVDAARFSNMFAKPLHGSWCFSGIPDALRRHFGIGEVVRPLPLQAFPTSSPRAQKVIFLLLDGLGWRFLDGGLFSHPFVRRFERDGVITKLTSQFPSTTVVHSTAMATGLTVEQTGILEWFYYEPIIGDVICPLPYTLAGEKGRETLLRHNRNINAIFPTQSLATEFLNEGIATYVYQHQRYTPSLFSRATMPKANLVPFSSPTEGIASLFQCLERDERQYHFLYIDTVDHISHVHGPSSSAAQLEADSLLTVLERRLFNHESAKIRDTLLLVTADHGQVDTDLGRVIYLNRVWPEIGNFLKKCSRNGKPIVPCGGVGRNLFLHVRPECVAEVRGRLTELLLGRAEVYSVKELADAGIFGFFPPTTAFWERVGDLVILPYASECVWWYDRDRFEVDTKGNHGGLTPEELHIPFFAFGF
jgi:hypothetical protein